MDTIIVKPKKSGKQCAVFVGRQQVALVCFGDNKPINFLKPACSGVKLTEEEKLEVAKATREQMAKLNAEQTKFDDELAAVAGRNYTYPKEATQSDVTDQGADSGGTDEAEDQDNPGS